jgi:CCR4-NOT transcription complex subunit 7/8
MMDKVSKERCLIRDVWDYNLEEEMANIQRIAEDFPVICIDTEFPGVVVQPVANQKLTPDYEWVRCNVNVLKLIQLGLTFSDRNGETPSGVCTWQFNFKFDLSMDMYAQDSIDLLQSSGMDFDRIHKNGIEPSKFAYLLTSSGLVLNDRVSWVAFHSAYDFAYLARVLTDNYLPDTEREFFELLNMWFGRVYDLKYILKSSYLNHRTGLNQIASDLKVNRIGPCHQAGSDSLLTCHAFFKLLESPHVGDFDSVTKKAVNVLYGLGADAGDDGFYKGRDYVFPTPLGLALSA